MGNIKMPAKKKVKKGKKKKKSSSEKKLEDGEKKPDEEKPKNNPEIVEHVSIATLRVKMTAPPIRIFDFEMKTPVTTRLFEIEDAIRRKHGGSIGKVALCLE